MESDDLIHITHTHTYTYTHTHIHTLIQSLHTFVENELKARPLSSSFVRLDCSIHYTLLVVILWGVSGSEKSQTNKKEKKKERKKERKKKKRMSS